jgi:CheY-like chemotaxis protein
VSRQARILLVDDRPENLIALEAILSSLNQIVVPVQSGEQAV